MLAASSRCQEGRRRPARADGPGGERIAGPLSAPRGLCGGQGLRCRGCLKYALAVRPFLVSLFWLPHSICFMMA